MLIILATCKDSARSGIVLQASDFLMFSYFAFYFVKGHSPFRGIRCGRHYYCVSVFLFCYGNVRLPSKDDVCPYEIY